MISLSDAEFDRFYDQRIRDLSQQHWTPVRVAVRAAKLLTLAGATRILDVGSGVGKFCIIGALSTDASYVGIERRRDLVEIAQRTAVRHGAHRVTFVHTDADVFSFEGFSGVYLYNPFYEQISGLINQIDGTTERSPSVHSHFVRGTTEKLEALAPPAVVVIYGGFGGNMPSSYRFVGDESVGLDQLELWIKD